jgi:hypothetical protein
MSHASPSLMRVFASRRIGAPTYNRKSSKSVCKKSLARQRPTKNHAEITQ